MEDQSAEGTGTNTTKKGRKKGVKVFTVSSLYKSVLTGSIQQDINSGMWVLPTQETINFVKSILRGNKQEDKINAGIFSYLETKAAERENAATVKKSSKTVSKDRPLKMTAKSFGTRGGKTDISVSRIPVSNIASENQSIFVHYYDDKIVISAKEERVNWIDGTVKKK